MRFCCEEAGLHSLRNLICISDGVLRNRLSPKEKARCRYFGYPSVESLFIKYMNLRTRLFVIQLLSRKLGHRRQRQRKVHRGEEWSPVGPVKFPQFDSHQRISQCCKSNKVPCRCQIKNLPVCLLPEEAQTCADEQQVFRDPTRTEWHLIPDISGALLTSFVGYTQLCSKENIATIPQCRAVGKII